MSDIKRLSERIESALKVEIGSTRADAEEFKSALLKKLPILRDLAHQHVLILNKFKRENPGVEFPALHKELFSMEAETQPVTSVPQQQQEQQQPQVHHVQMQQQEQQQQQKQQQQV